MISKCQSKRTLLQRKYLESQGIPWLSCYSWEQRKVGEVSKRVIVGLATSVTPYYREEGVPILRNLNIKENYLDDTDILFLDRPYAESQVSKQIHAGDVLTVHTGYIGISCVVPEKYDNCLTFTTLITTTDDAVLEGAFLAQYLNSEIGMSAVQAVTTQGGRQNLNTNDFVKVEIRYPSLAEQSKICAVLSRIDNLITLHQRQRKNSMRNCSCLPFSWEQRKLSELAEIVGGGTPDTNNSAYWDGDIDWYAPAEMEGQRYAVSSVRKITELGLQKSSAKMLPAHRTVLFTSRAGIGEMAILQRPAATNQGFQSLVLRDGIDPYFIYSMGDKIKGIAEGVASGSTFLEISGKMLGSLEVMTPSIEEQKEIASFFRGIDDLITLHQC